MVSRYYFLFRNNDNFDTEYLHSTLLQYDVCTKMSSGVLINMTFHLEVGGSSPSLQLLYRKFRDMHVLLHACLDPNQFSIN